GHLVAAALGTHPGQLRRLGQRQVELPQSGQEAKAFDVGLAVPAVSRAVSGGLWQQPEALIGAQGLRSQPELGGQFADSHADTLDPVSDTGSSGDVMESRGRFRSRRPFRDAYTDGTALLVPPSTGSNE